MPTFGADESPAERVAKILRSSLLRDSSLFFAARVLGAVATFMIHWILAKWLGADQQGAYTDAFSWAILIASIGLLGFPRAAYRFLPAYKGHDDWSHARGFMQAGMRLAAAVGVAGFATGLLWLTMGDRHSVFAVGMLTVLPLIIMNHLTGIAQGLYWRVLAAIPKDSLRPILMLVALVLAWYATPTSDAFGVMWLQFAVAASVCAVTYLITRRRLHRIYGGVAPAYDTRKWVAAGVPTMLTNLTVNLYPELNVVIVGVLLDDAQVGIFYIAFRIAFLIGFGLVAVDQATLPYASKCYALADLAGMERRLRHAGMLKIAGTVGTFLVLALFGSQILGLFGDGEEYRSGYTPMLWLAGLLLLRALAGPVAELLSIVGQHNQAAVLAGITVVLTVGLDLILVPGYGIAGAAVSAFVASAISTLIMTWRLAGVAGIMPCPLLPARARG